MPRLIHCRLGAALPVALILASLLGASPERSQAQAKSPGTVVTTTGPEAGPAVLDDLTPEMVDTMMARLTDAQIRELLREELRRRADEQAAAEEAEVMTLVKIRARLTAMASTIEARITRWIDALANIGSRRDDVARKLARAENGITGMIIAALAVAIAGLGAAILTIWACGLWRSWLISPQRATYWDRVVRTGALGLVELMPVVAFVLATRASATLVAGSLGPLVDYIWIYHAGISYSWGAIVVSRRAFAPDAPIVRIAHLTDATAIAIHRLLRRAVMIGATGWLIAGLSPTLGFGFPPALITVAFAGTAVAAVLLLAAVRNVDRIRTVLSSLLIHDSTEPSALIRIVVASAPVLLVIYLAGAYVYWLAHWLERGQQRLDGPVGTLIFFLFFPILDRLGLEIARNVVRSGTPAAQRYRGVLHSTWRMGLGLAAVFVVAGLWGLDLYMLAKGEHAPRWADTLFDIAITLLLAHFVWRLILAALHTEEATSARDEEDDLGGAAATRLDTLVPLLRNVLLTMLTVVVMMILLSSAGVDIGPLLASAGIVGIAVGFGAQTLVRDVFAGAFFLIDDAFRIGEYIELDQDLRGEVESISVRSLQLRHHRGPVITIPFGELKSVTNHNRDWVIYKMSFRMEPETDPNQVKKIVKEVGKEFMAHPEHGMKFLEPLKSQGVHMIDDDSAQVFRVKFKCKPRAQFVLRREIYHRLREVFAEHGIHFARRKVEVVAADGAGDIDGHAAAATGEAPTDRSSAQP